MTEQQPPPADDLTADDVKVSRTDNGWKDGDGPQPVQSIDPEQGRPS